MPGAGYLERLKSNLIGGYTGNMEENERGMELGLFVDHVNL